jgi:hypothetical protein
VGGRSVLGLVVLLGACDAELGGGPGGGSTNTQPDGGNPQTDGGSGVDAPTMLGPWGTAQKIPGADSTLGEDDATLSTSRLELYFKRGDATGGANLYVMTRLMPTDAWGMPTALTVLNSSVDEESPRLSDDQLTLYFGRGGDIYKSTRTAIGAPWGAAQAVTTLNTAAYEKWGVACANGYAMVSRGVTGQGQDLFEGTLAAGTNMAVAQLNSVSAEQGIFLSSDCLKLYFQSNRTNNQFDMYLATRTSATAQWSNPTLLPDFNTAVSSEEDPWVATDQRTFVFASNSSGNKDLYISTR